MVDLDTWPGNALGYSEKIQLPCPEPKRDDSEEAVENTLQRLGPPCLDSPEQSDLDSLAHNKHSPDWYINFFIWTLNCQVIVMLIRM